MNGGLFFLLVLGLALIPAAIAREKGLDARLFYAFGLLFVVPAVIVALAVEAQAPCPNCSAKNRVSARFCSSCGTEIPRKQETPAAIEVSISGEASSVMTPMQRAVLARRAKPPTP